MKIYLLFSLVAATSNAASAFIFQSPVTHRALEGATAQADGATLNIRLDIGGDDEYSQRMVLQGLSFQLFDKAATGDHPTMPGADGPNAKLSSGARELFVQNDAQYIDMNGLQKVPLVNGCWEMIWPDESPAGNLVCGFHLEKEVKRNDATMPAGRIYLSFPVWTAEGLAEQQAVKKQVLARASEFEKKKQEQLEMYEQTNNVLMKALHFRNAARAIEQIEYTSADTISNSIPDDQDTLEIQNGLLLTTKGTVWTKKPSFLGSDHALLGSAMITPVTREE